MDVDGTENVPKNALRGSELPISRGIQGEVTDGPLGETVVAGSVPAVRSPVISCASVETTALNVTAEALPSGLTF